MSACDALVFTSMQEGSPNVVKEALACNLPVVSVPVGDVAVRLQGIEGCELCEDDAPETIAAALGRVLARESRIAGREAVKVSGRERDDGKSLKHLQVSTGDSRSSVNGCFNQAQGGNGRLILNTWAMWSSYTPQQVMTKF